MLELRMCLAAAVLGRLLGKKTIIISSEQKLDCRAALGSGGERLDANTVQADDLDSGSGSSSEICGSYHCVDLAEASCDERGK
ncbi:hypothetical protein EVG20_g7937 [Dentipellis fragilis]|uniref:Uncharacterized protein n=1 Tax=Dentipellis fragilis TaxID=205917 RepID=A0A4Y9Y911_9AGAM|nr:hypothetical protein EVG20_g7937 [Dentipellis fragilis]